MKAVRDNPEKYYKLVLWACGNNLSFDTQCEGTRSWYVYQMINFFEDKTAFLQVIIDKFNTYKISNQWQILYLSELLFLMSENDYSPTINLLWDKYEQLYEKLLTLRQPPKRHFYELDCFESVSLVLAYNESTVIKIANDIGRLYENENVFNSCDFSWLYFSKMKPFKIALKKKLKI